MKIAVLCTFRTRSSYLTDVLSKHYNIKDIWEPYENLTRSVFRSSFNRSPTNLWQAYKTQVPKLTDTFLEQGNFVLKIFNHAYFNSYKIEYHLERKLNFSFDDTDYCDLINHFKLDKYDQIYFLNRKNVHDNIISFLFGMQTKMLYSEDQIPLLSKHKKIKKLSYDPLNLKILVSKNMLMPFYLNQLKKIGLPFIELDYEDIPNYVSEHFPNVQTEYVESNINYKELICNYDETVGEIEKYKKELEPYFIKLLSQ